MKRKNITDENLTDNSVFYAASLTASPIWDLDDTSYESKTFYRGIMKIICQNICGTSCYKSIYEAVCHWRFEALHE